MAEKILQLEDNQQHKLFYAPFADVVVDGKSLLRHCLEVTSVSVDDNLTGMNQFTFVINNAFDLTNREFISLHPPQTDQAISNGRLDEFFSFGKKVEIHIGYLDNLEKMLTGVITSVRTSFPAGQTPQLTVTGHDKSYKMSRDKQSRPAWNDKTDSEIVQEIAGDYDLQAVVDDSEVTHPRVEQDQETDRRFIERLAKRNCFEFYIRDDQLFFRRPSNHKAGLIELEWGVSLLSFSPELNLAEQVSDVEVHGWNVDTKSPIVGKAKIGDELGRETNPGGGRRSGGEFVKSAFQGAPTTYRVRQPVYSQQEADRLAKSIMKKRSEGLIKASGESIGLPEIRADMNIKLNGLGERFSTTYYVEKATHKVDSSGYKTTFNIKDTTI